MFSKLTSLLVGASALIGSSQSLAMTHQYDARSPLIKSSMNSNLTLDDSLLGGGFSQDSEIPKAISCLSGNGIIDNNGNTLGQVGYQLDSNYQNFTKDYSVHVNGKISWLNATANMPLVTMESGSSIDSTIILRLKFTAPSERFNPEDKAMPLNNRGLAAYQKGAETFYSKCGDKYISLLQKGGVFDLIIRFSFANEQFKSQFESEIDTGHMTIGELQVAVKKSQKKYKENLNVYITAVQLGGNPSALDSIFGHVTGDNVKACDMAACFSILDDLKNYVSVNGPLHTSWNENPAVIGIKTLAYDSILVGYNLDDWNSKVNEQIEDARSKLYAAMSDQYHEKTKISSALNFSFTPIIQKRWIALEAKYKALEELNKSNISALTQALDICYNDVDNCVSAKVNTIANLSALEFPRDPSAVYQLPKVDIGKGGTEVYCDAPESAVIVGIGAKVTKDNVVGVRIKYRLVNADGSLGSVGQVQCGTPGIEQLVQVPSGYVVTGFGGRVKRSNLRSMYVLARQWDSESRQLIGPTSTYNIGRSVEMLYDLSIHGPSSIDTFFDTDHGVVTGAGFKVKNDNINGLTARVGFVY